MNLKETDKISKVHDRERGNHTDSFPAHYPHPNAKSAATKALAREMIDHDSARYKADGESVQGEKSIDHVRPNLPECHGRYSEDLLNSRRQIADNRHVAKHQALM
ncbi:uncharacterized protein PADG_01358 [Paracoccidioides brasiliensis Pb18]|uniref:Uncharacterized protein n=1 Tax=Paracoccidioides brasiliensis (strain Pb18) TaxID=502780 RepID=C1G342_PARBD|nr:uncharacterized protein PADG_01358 [Paracoccidioides brasiliensis Pb18]EEH45208.2 hypothetical protein PADG_01358 [Paracoccidioides brasiliensis Pb18]